MVVQLPGDAQSVHFLVGESPLRQLHRHPRDKMLPASYLHDWESLATLSTEGTKEFIFCPQCVNSMQITAPENYQMFILVNSNTLNSIVLIQDEYILQIDPSYSLATLENNRQIVYESKIISNRLAIFYQEAKTDYPGREILLSDLARIITSLLIRRVVRPVVANNESRKSKGVEQAIDYINKNYHKKVTLNELANYVNYSQFHFIRIFQKETGKTPFEYLTDIRVNKAKEFLSTTNQSITEICLQCGLQNSSHFANFFKLHTGVSPSEFRQNLE